MPRKNRSATIALTLAALLCVSGFVVSMKHLGGTTAARGADTPRPVATVASLGTAGMGSAAAASSAMAVETDAPEAVETPAASAAPADASAPAVPTSDTAVDDEPVVPKYAAVVIAPAKVEVASEGAAAVPADKQGGISEDVLTIGYILEDPMAGRFTLERVDMRGGKVTDGFGKFSGGLAANDREAAMSFVYVAGGEAGIFAKPGAALARDLPGKTRILVQDLTTAGPDDAVPTVTIARRAEGAAEAVVFDLTGPAGKENTGAKLVADALAGTADKDRNRALTLGEFADYMAKEAKVGGEYDLGETAGVEIIKYRTPSVIAKQLGPDKTMLLAARYIAQQRWIEAIVMLREVKDTKITDAEYKRLSEAAQVNLALLSRYDTDASNENICREPDKGLDLISDILLLADLHYVTDVDNRTLFAGGARNVQMLLENRVLSSDLVPAANRARVPQFAAFVKETVDRVFEKPSMTENDFRMRVKRILMENDATIQLPSGVIVTEFIYGIPEALDQHTTYFPVSEYKQFQDDTIGHFGGLGIEITLEDKVLTVITPMEGTPAADAGIMPGDRIVAIEKDATEKMTLNEAVSRLRGPIGTKVTITVIHRGDTAPIKVAMTRASVNMDSVFGYAVHPDTGQWQYMVDGEAKIGYVRIKDFKEQTAADLDKAMAVLQEGGVKALILDLRFNHGGLLTSGLQVSERFLSSGRIVSCKGAHMRTTTYDASSRKTYPKIPVVLLVNEESASSSEIVAGALHDNGRALLVGTKTFGKGTVQTIFELERGQSAIKLTTARYYTPSGVSIHRDQFSTVGGIKPDIEVEMTPEDNMLLADIWHLRGLRLAARERLMAFRKELSAKDPNYKIADPATYRDLQMEKAIDTLKGELKGKVPASVAGATASAPVMAGEPIGIQ